MLVLVLVGIVYSIRELSDIDTRPGDFTAPGSIPTVLRHGTDHLNMLCNLQLTIDLQSFDLQARESGTQPTLYS